MNRKFINLALITTTLAAIPLAAFAGAPAANPASQPPATAPTAEPTMQFHFQSAPVQTVLAEMSARLHFQIIQSLPIDARITLDLPDPVTADQAIDLLNSVLIPLHVAAVDDSIELPSTTIRILRVLPIKEAMAMSPVGEIRTGN